jgi:hypothetical protein
MTIEGSSKAAMRKRHLKFVAVLIGVAAFCWLTMQLKQQPIPPPILPRIDVGAARYIDEWRPAAGDPVIKVAFTITNTGPFAFSFNPWADVVRYDSGAGWATDHIGGAFKSSRSVINFSNEYFLFGRGSVTTGTAWIPAKASRWQVGYMVHFPSTRQRVEDKLGTNWTKRATRALGDFISENDGLAEIWGPVLEMPARDQAANTSLQRSP